VARFRGPCIAFGLPKLLFLVLRYVAPRAIIFSLLRRVRVLVGDGSVSNVDVHCRDDGIVESLIL